jgi:hypothetical protein
MINEKKESIKDFPDIQQQQPEVIKSAFWLKNELFKHHFGTEQISIERQGIHDAFSRGEKQKGILMTLAWGYPNAMRRFTPDEENVALIEQILYYKKDLSKAQLYQCLGGLLQVEGIGPSTATKLLYFSGNKYKKIPCVILDKRVEDSIKRCAEFDGVAVNLDAFKISSYISYLEKVDQLAGNLSKQHEAIELILFSKRW